MADSRSPPLTFMAVLNWLTHVESSNWRASKLALVRLTILLTSPLNSVTVIQRVSKKSILSKICSYETSSDWHSVEYLQKPLSILVCHTRGHTFVVDNGNNGLLDLGELCTSVTLAQHNFKTLVSLIFLQVYVKQFVKCTLKLKTVFFSNLPIPTGCEK